VSTPAESVGSGGPTGSSVESAARNIGGLEPGTTYYFRVVAGNAVGPAKETAKSEGMFTTLSAVTSSERGYELVTPAVKEGGSDMFAQIQVEGEFLNESDDGVAGESGEAFLLHSTSPFGEFPFAIEGAYVFHREPARGGWGYKSLASRPLGLQSFVGGLFEPFDMMRVALTDGVGARVGAGGERFTDLLGPPGGSSVCAGPVSVGAAVSDDCYVGLHADKVGFHESAEESAATEVVGASRDLGHIVLESRSVTKEQEAVEGEACPGAKGVAHGHVLCEWDGGYEAAGQPVLGLVNVKPGGEPGQPVSECGAGIGDPFPELGDGPGSDYRAVSADGSRVFFTAPDPQAAGAGAGCWNGQQAEAEKGPEDAPQLYVRVNGEQTLEVSKPESKSIPKNQIYPAYYAGASADGSRVFFATKTELTKEAAALKLHDLELYECQITEAEGEPGCTLTRVSAGESGTAGHEHGAQVEHVPAVAADGGAVYFTAGAQLTSANPAGGVYRYDTATGATSYVAGGALWEPRTAALVHGECPQISCSRADWYTTPDGRFLLFVGHEAGGFVGVERYDALAAERGEPALTCVSCVAGGKGGEARFARSAMYGATAGPARAMSDNGEYVFFDSPEPLVTQAENDTLDTYEWHDGQILLIGSGATPGPTFFLGYSPYEYETPAGKHECARNTEREPEPGTHCEVVEGGNVFIGTHAQLSTQDTNSLGNVYDARICEPGSPCIEPPVGGTAICEGSTCHTPPPLPPFQTPGTLTLSSSGNVTPESPPSPPRKTTTKTLKCKKNFVRKKVKKKEVCIKRPKKKSKADKSDHGRTSR
jgi:hypothetical protein